MLTYSIIQISYRESLGLVVYGKEVYYYTYMYIHIYNYPGKVRYGTANAGLEGILGKARNW